MVCIALLCFSHVSALPFPCLIALVLVLVYTTHSCCWQVLAYICFNRLLIRWHLRLRFLSRVCSPVPPVRWSLRHQPQCSLNSDFVLLGVPVRLPDKSFVFDGLLWLLSCFDLYTLEPSVWRCCTRGLNLADVTVFVLCARVRAL